MENKSFTATIEVSKSPQDVFKCLKEVPKWWSRDFEGNSKKLNDEFIINHPNQHYSKQKLIEVVPGKKVVWLVTDSRLNFLKDKTEWTNMKIVFEIAEKGKQTEVRFTQLGLLPEIECYNACSNAWTDYVQNSLRNLIDTGKGQPSPREK